MAEQKKQKKNLIISFKNLPKEIQDLFFETYPDKSYLNYMQSMTTPKGELLHLVNLETEETSYMIKMDVKIDTFDVDDIAGADTENDEAPESDGLNEYMDNEDGENQSHNVGKLNYGADEEMMKAVQQEINDECEEEEEEDDYENRDKFGDSYDDDINEPSDEELAEINIDFDMESLLNDNILEGIDTGKKPTTKQKAASTTKNSTAKSATTKKSATKTAKATTTKSKGAAKSTTKTAAKKTTKK